MLQRFSLRHFVRRMSGHQLDVAGPAVVLVSALGHVGCAASPAEARAEPPLACELAAPQLGIAASQHINAPPGEPGLPVQVRVYQLSSVDAFDDASFEKVWMQAGDLFGKSILDVQELSVYPSDRRQWTAALIPETRTLAFVALFREPHNNEWFVAYGVAPPNEHPPCVGEVLFSVWLDGMRMRAGAGPGGLTRIGHEKGE